MRDELAHDVGERDFLTTHAAAAVCGVDRHTVTRWISAGLLRAEQAGRAERHAYRVPREALEELLLERERARANKQPKPAKRAPAVPSELAAQLVAASQRLAADHRLPRDLVEAIAFHSQLLTRLRRSVSAHRSYRLFLGMYLAFLAERDIAPDLAALTPQLVGDCLDSLRDRVHGKQDGAAEQAALTVHLKAFARVLVEQGVYATDPLARLKRMRPPKPNRAPYTDAELAAMIKAAASSPAPARDRALLLLLLDTGCRIGELCAADVGDVDLERGLITFRRTKNGQTRRVLFGIGDQGGPCLQALRDWLSIRVVTATSPLFTGPRNPRLTPSIALKIIVRIGQAAGVKNPGCHRFRHTSATQYLSRRPGAEIQLRARLGHVDPGVLATYVHMTQSMAEDGAQVASISTRLLAAPAVGQRDRLQTLQSILALLERDPGLGRALQQVLSLAAVA